jgi:hypothetical protein
MQMVSSSIPMSLTAGRLEGIGLPDLLWNLCRRRSTGVLHVTARAITKRVYIKEGRIIFAASADPDDRLGEMLLRDGVVRVASMERAIARLHEGKRLGTLLVESGDLLPEQLVRAVVGQVRTIVLGLFEWEAGEYRFDEGPLPTEEVITLGMKTGEVLLQGIRSVSSFSRIRRGVGSDRARYRASSDWRSMVDGLALGEGERSLLEKLEGDGETVDRLCQLVSLSNFEVYQALWAFRVLGAVQEVDRSLEHAPSGALEGSLASEGFPRLLVRLCREGGTGVLYVSRGSHERTFHLRDGRCVFATSNNVDDGLLAHLLRRGVISLRDREETAKRLLSNKRVGTILLEMGVIDEIDLARLVREQLSEVLYDTFRWTDGEWIFGPGELPTTEGITVDRSLEDLVLEGIRRVASWARVRDGIGGLGARLVLTSEYLGILDRMTVGAEDWALVARFRTPSTPMELFASGSLPDFRVAQTLWALRLLGVVEEAASDDVVDLALAGGKSEAFAADPPVENEAGVSDPDPVTPADVAETRPSEATRPEDPEPASADERDAVPPSDWNETEQNDVQEIWTSPDDAPALEVSEAEEDDGALVNEPWQLVAEDARSKFSPPEPSQEDGDAASPAEGEPEHAGFEMAEPSTPENDSPRLPVWGLESEVVEADRAAEGPSEGVQDRPTVEENTDAKSSGDVVSAPDQRTVRISRDDLEAALRAPEPDDTSAGESPAAKEFRDNAKTIPVPENESGSNMELLPASLPTPSTDPETASRSESLSSSLSDDAPEGLNGAEADSPPEASNGAESPTGPETPEASEETWDPPANLDAEISRFNGRHKALFRVLRSELGAGAVPFVRNCRATLNEEISDVFGETTLLPDGTWDSVELKKAVCESRSENFSDAFDVLLAEELGRIRPQIGDSRARGLEELLDGVR